MTVHFVDQVASDSVLRVHVGVFDLLEAAREIGPTSRGPIRKVASRYGARAIPHLVVLAMTTDLEVQCGEALGRIDTSIAPELVRLVLDAERNPRRSSLAERSEKLGRMASAALVAIGRTAVPHVLSGIAGADPDSRTLLIRVLEDIGPPARTAIPALLKMFQASRKEYHREFLLRVLKNIDAQDGRLLSELRRCLRSSRAYVRQEAALGLTGVSEASDELAHALLDEDDDVRKAAACALRAVDDPHVRCRALWRSRRRAVGEARARVSRLYNESAKQLSTLDRITLEALDD